VGWVAPSCWQVRLPPADWDVLSRVRTSGRRWFISGHVGVFVAFLRPQDFEGG
jgi:hypothetical protein